MEQVSLTGVLIRDNRLSQRSWTYCAYLLLFLPLSYLALLFLGGAEGSWTALHLVYYTLVFGHFAYRFFTTGTQSLIAPDMLFVMAYTLVNWGMISCIWLGLVPISESELLFTASIPKALHLTILGLVAFLLCYEITGEGRSSFPAPRVQRAVWVPRQGWGFVGLALMCLGILLHVAGLFSIGFEAIMKYGYGAIQNAGEFTDSEQGRFLLSISIPISAIGVFTYCSASTIAVGKLFRSKSVFYLWLAWVLVVLLEGDRGGVVKLALPAVLLLHYVIRPIKTRYLVLLCVASVVIFSALAFARNAAVFSPKQMVAEYLYAQERNDTAKWYSVVYELGNSFQILTITVHGVPSAEPYWKGASWRDSVIHIVPFAQGVAMRSGWSRWEPSDWVTKTYFGESRSGKGFNCVAEGYLNFATPGVLIEMGFLGALLRWLVRQFRKSPSTRSLMIMIAGLGPIMMMARNHVNLLFAPLAQVIVFAGILAWLLGSERATAHLYPGEDAGPEERLG